jgi:acyl carrier protein
VPPLAQVSVRVGRRAPVRYDFGALQATRLIPAEWGAVKYDLALAVDQDGDELHASLNYRHCLFDEATADRIAGSFVAILEQLVDDPGVVLADLRTMPRRVLRTVLDRWNPADLPPDVATRTGLSGPARCYVLDRYGRPAPVNVPGELYVSGVGEVPDPYAGLPGARMCHTGVLARWTPDGRLAPVDAAPVERPDAGATDAAAADDVLVGVRAIWSELLGVADIPPQADFFDLGGDSLFAIRLMSRIRKAFQVRLSLKDIFGAPTLSDQASLVTSRRST